MLIELDSAIGDQLADLSDSEWDALNNLAITAREGNHILVAPRTLATALSRDERIGPREQSVYRLLYQRFSTLASACGTFKTRACVTRILAPVRSEHSGRCTIEVPLASFSRTENIQASVLCAEHQSDCDLIAEMARAFAAASGLGGVRVVFDMLPGGGSAMGAVVTPLLTRQKRFLLALVDSDRMTPQSTLGDTARGVKRVFTDNPSATGSLMVLGAHELENLLPDEFFRSAFGRDEVHGGSAAFICALDDIGCGLARLHIDIKSGISLRDLLDPPSIAEDHDEVWSPVVRAVAQRRLPANVTARECATGGTCGRHTPCVATLTRANGSAILELGARMYRENRRELWASLPTCIKGEAERVARTALDWGCATAHNAG